MKKRNVMQGGGGGEEGLKCKRGRGSNTWTHTVFIGARQTAS